MFLRKKNGLQYKFNVIIVMTLVLGIAAYLFPLNIVDGESMLPTLHSSDVIVTSRLSKVERGDIIVGFLDYGDKVGKELVVKRVLAIEGDTIEIQKDSVLVNGEKVAEQYTLDSTMQQTMNEIKIEPGKLFVLGDNRNDSCDSRSVGCMNVSDCVGVVKKVIGTVH